ncbi:major facilitator superfamily-domain-containing protein [Phialemonium atrogriseum]|uniref:Major facilitator superfamily-domain-containing protein n=1 Tax=Phialemonium atrogriseum TaxID=1093897 RepID=A0AAJ0BZN6_9PEZI|nr:major facilitator superfamily-domain-containing protein [Phialemonium atrogriseum]KAK1766383.1 major facilitator superfamily-domain-containing protein [Phialemonium atrogriseum]
MEKQRPASVLPSSPGMVSDLRVATEAMQRAADAMVAATESFRRETQTQNTAPMAQHSEESLRESGRDSLSLMPFATPAGSSVSIGTSVDRRSLSRPRTAGSGNPGQSSSSSNRPLIPELSSPPPLPDFFPRRQTYEPVHTDDSYFGAPVNHSPPAAEPVQHLSSIHTLDWPVTTGSTPTLTPAPVVQPGPGHQWPIQPYRNWTSHVDLVEAAERYKSHSSPQSGLEGNRDEYGNENSVPLKLRRAPLPGRATPDSSRTSSITSRTNGANGIRPPLAGASAAPEGFSLSHEVSFVLVICLAQVLMLAGIGQALAPASIIGQTFPDTTPGSLAWYSAAYGLTAGTFVLPAGRFGDLFGHKKIFILGFLWFALWSVVAGFAEMIEFVGGHGTVFFCFSRAMQGIGPALLVPNGQAMLGRAYQPGPRKNLVMSLFGAAAPLGFVVGAVMSTLFAIKASWPWAFWSQGAVCVGLAAVSVLVLPPTRQTRKNDRESLWVQLDGYGMVFGVCGLVLFNFSFNQAPIVSWASSYTYFILIISVMLIAAFVYTELVAPYPLVPIAAMHAQTNFVLGCTGAGWACFSIWVYYSFSFLENLRGWSPLLASAAYSPGPISGLIASLLTGYLMSRIKPHWIMFVSMCAFFTGSILMVTAPVDQNYWYNTFLSILIMPFGMDMSNPAATILLSNIVSKEHQGIAASLVVTVVNYSISIALGIAGTVETHVNDGGQNIHAGYRGAQYFGLGLGGLGIVLAATFLVQSYMRASSSLKA